MSHYEVRRTFQVDGFGTIELVERSAGYDSYHIRRKGDNSTHLPRISKRDARVLLNDAPPDGVLSRYLKMVR